MRELQYVITTCKFGHKVKVKPATVVVGKAIFGSAIDFCDKMVNGQHCERPVVDREPVYKEAK